MKRKNSILWNFLLIVLCVLLFLLLTFFLAENKRSEGVERKDLEKIAQEHRTKNTTQSVSQNGEEVTESDIKNVTGISCWGDEFLKRSDAVIYSYPAVLQEILEENAYDINVKSKTLGGGSTLSVMKMAGVSDDVLQDYVESHQEAVGNATPPITEVGIRDFTEEELIREDKDDIPIIFMGYYGGWNNDIEELMEQQQRVLDTFEKNKEKFLIVGMPPSNGIISQEDYDKEMKEKWGEHYMSGLEAASPNAVASYDGQKKIANMIYEKLVDLKYIIKE